MKINFFLFYLAKIISLNLTTSIIYYQGYEFNAFVYFFRYFAQGNRFGQNLSNNIYELKTKSYFEYFCIFRKYSI
jgi:hypothetical protein